LQLCAQTARVQLTAPSEVHEVIDIRGDEDPILLECFVEDAMVVHPQHVAVADAARIDAFGTQCPGDRWR